VCRDKVAGVDALKAPGQKRMCPKVLLVMAVARERWDKAAEEGKESEGACEERRCLARGGRICRSFPRLGVAVSLTYRVSPRSLWSSLPLPPAPHSPSPPSFSSPSPAPDLAPSPSSSPSSSLSLPPSLAPSPSLFPFPTPAHSICFSFFSISSARSLQRALSLMHGVNQTCNSRL